NRITPLMWSPAPAVVNSISRYARRRSSVLSQPIVSKRFLMVPLDSSAARIPLPGATIARATSCRLMDSSRDVRRTGQVCRTPPSGPQPWPVVPPRANIVAPSGTTSGLSGPDEQQDHRVVAGRGGDGHHVPGLVVTERERPQLRPAAAERD